MFHIGRSTDLVRSRPSQRESYVSMYQFMTNFQDGRLLWRKVKNFILQCSRVRAILIGRSSVRMTDLKEFLYNLVWRSTIRTTYLSISFEFTSRTVTLKNSFKICFLYSSRVESIYGRSIALSKILKISLYKFEFLYRTDDRPSCRSSDM